MKCRALLACALLATLALCSCSPLPKDWPIKELTLPPASTAAAVPEKARSLRERLNRIEGVEDRIPLTPKYEVAFNTKSDWDSIISSVTGQITPLGFKEWKPAETANADEQAAGLAGGQSFANLIRIYEKEDKSMFVFIINTSAMTSSGDPIDTEGDYILGIQPR